MARPVLAVPPTRYKQLTTAYHCTTEVTSSKTGLRRGNPGFVPVHCSAASLSLSKTGTKAVLIERIMQAGPPAPTYFDLPSSELIKDIVNNLAGVKLAQRTPERVAHRRADLIRRRVVYETSNLVIEINEDGEREVEFTLRCESGTYVKETVHGDSGRTQPSISSLIKAKCDVMWLDVADIHAD